MLVAIPFVYILLLFVVNMFYIIIKRLWEGQSDVLSRTPQFKLAFISLLLLIIFYICIRGIFFSKLENII